MGVLGGEQGMTEEVLKVTHHIKEFSRISAVFKVN